MKFVWGIIWIIIGTLIIKYTYQIVQNFGTINWAERHLSGGMGGTYAMYKIVGVIIILLAFFYMFGGLGFITRPLGGVFGG